MSTGVFGKPISLLSQLAWRTVSVGYGIFNLGAFILLAYVRKGAFRTLGENGRKELATARNKIWNLEGRPYGVVHRFCTLRNGSKLHYVESLPTAEASSKTSLVIFIHGFPDSWFVWQHYLKSRKLKEQTVMVAVDLPGFGGSDSFATYTPEAVLEAVTEFILKMRERYIPAEAGKPRSPSRVVLVGHDWGALIGFRLAAEAPQLADRFVLSNSIHPALALSNAQGRLTTTGQMLRTWLHKPSNVKLLLRAATNVLPMFKQFMKSGYVFLFNLPLPLANVIGNVGDFWFLRYINAIATDPDPKLPLEGMYGAEALASSVGPSTKECDSSPNGQPELAYSDSVRHRASNGGWTSKISVYRDDLAFGPWAKSLETLWDLNQIDFSTGRRDSTADLFEVGPVGTLRGRTTVIWGKNDAALENSLAIEGMGDFFGGRPSQLITVEKSSHWAPLDKQAVSVFEAVIEWAVQGEKGTLREKFGDEHTAATFAVER